MRDLYLQNRPSMIFTTFLFSKKWEKGSFASERNSSLSRYFIMKILPVTSLHIWMNSWRSTSWQRRPTPLTTSTSAPSDLFVFLRSEKANKGHHFDGIKMIQTTVPGEIAEKNVYVHEESLQRFLYICKRTSTHFVSQQQ